jgi:hypothetical protein
MSTMTPDDLEDYRREARAWIAANLDPKQRIEDPAAANLRGSRRYTREEIDAERPKQRALFDAGYAGDHMASPIRRQRTITGTRARLPRRGRGIRPARLRIRKLDDLRYLRPSHAGACLRTSNPAICRAC